MLMVSFAVGTGVGASVLLSRSLGEGNKEKASVVAGNTLLLGFILVGIFVLFGLTCPTWYIGSQTNTPLVQTMGVDYLCICCSGSFGYVFFGMYEKLIQSTGRTLYATTYLFAQLVQSNSEVTWLLWSTFVIGEFIPFLIAIGLFKKTLVEIETL